MRYFCKIYCSLIFMLTLCPPLLAQQPGQTDAENEEIEEIEEIEEVGEPGSASLWDSNNFATLERSINIFTPRTVRKNNLLFIVEHRTRKSLKDDTFQDLFGYDAGGLKVGLGLRYGLSDRLDAGFYRLNGTNEIFDVYEFDFKFRALSEKQHHFDLALRGGLTWFSQPDAEEASGFLGQILLGKTIKGRVSLGSGLLLHTNSSSGSKSLADEDYSLAVPLQLEVRLGRKRAWLLEVVPSVAGYRQAHPVVATSYKIITHRHTFSLVVGNTPYVSSDGIIANTGRSLKDVIVGFSITRELGPN